VRPIAALCVAALATACAATPPAPPIETTRTVAGAPDEVRARLQSAAGGLGLTAQVERDALRLTRSGAPVDWADCPTMIVRNNDGEAVRVDFAAPQARMADVHVSLTPVAGGTAVAVSTGFTATYRDVYRNLPRTGPCTSAGLLERALLDAAG
jgi:hypothetical protein